MNFVSGARDGAHGARGTYATLRYDVRLRVRFVKMLLYGVRNGHGSALPNMNGIEIPDPYCESELRQRLGIAKDMCYTILESPEQASK